MVITTATTSAYSLLETEELLFSFVKNSLKVVAIPVLQMPTKFDTVFAAVLFCAPLTINY